MHLLDELLNALISINLNNRNSVNDGGRILGHVRIDDWHCR